MAYRGRGMYPAQVPGFRYGRPGVPRAPGTAINPPSRGLLGVSPRIRFEPPRGPRPRQFIPRANVHQVPRANVHQAPRANMHHTPRANVHQAPRANMHHTPSPGPGSFRGFKAEPMIPRSECGSSPSPDKGQKNLQSESAKEFNKVKDEGQSANSASGPAKMEITKTMELNSKKELTSKPDSNLSSSYEEISNQDPNFDESSNQDLHVEQTTNQSGSKVDTISTNENTYFDESANQEAFSEQIDESSHQAQEDVRDADYGGMEGEEEGEGMNEEEMEEEEEEEDTSFCHYCKVPFDSDDAYWKHTRGLLHTQKVMEYENSNATSQATETPKKGLENRGEKLLPSPTTKMENTASEKDLEYLRFAGYNVPGSRGRGSRRGGHESRTSNFSRGHSTHGYGRGQSQGQNHRGAYGQGMGQGYSKYGKSFGDSGLTDLGPREEQADDEYSRYGDNGGYQDYDYQQDDYGQGGDYDFGGGGNGGRGYNDEWDTRGGERGGYNFNSSNWMEMDQPPEQIPVNERDLNPEAIGKPQFSVDFYCKDCDIRCTSQKNFEMHVEGTKHKMKTLLGKGDSVPNLKEKKKVVTCSRPSTVEHIIRKSDLPIIGLQYITEFQRSDPSARSTYVCNLCESKCDMNTVLSHVTGFKHRMNYFKENYPDIYNHMNSAASTKKKSEQNASAEEFAQDCMKRDGRGQIKVKLEIDPKTEAIAANLLSQSGITRDSFLEDVRNKTGQSGPEKKKQRITPDILAQQESSGIPIERGYNKRASDVHYDFPSKQARGQRGYSGGENQFNPYNQSPSQGGMQSRLHGDQWGPNRGPQGKDTSDEDPELFKEFLEWKKQRKMRSDQSQQSVETSQSVPVQAGQQAEKPVTKEGMAADMSSSSSADIMMALSQTLIKTEEDAAMALQVSNALTQALLQYRLKNVPKELTAALSTGSEQINPVQSKTTESRPGSYNRPMKPKATSVVQAPAQNPSSVPYPQPMSATPSQLSGSSAYTNTVPSSVPTVSDPLLNYTNPVNPTYPTDASALPQYSGPVVTSAQYPPGFSYYEGQYQPPEGYQWGYGAANQGDVPPPPPPKEDLPKPPPENQTY